MPAMMRSVSWRVNAFLFDAFPSSKKLKFSSQKHLLNARAKWKTFCQREVQQLTKDSQMAARKARKTRKKKPLTAKRRSAIARKAARARWGHKKTTKRKTTRKRKSTTHRRRKTTTARKRTVRRRRA